MDDPFYAEGLRFACARCSSCCRGGPGFVFLAKSDLSRLLGFLHLAFPAFYRDYCTLVDTGMGMALSLAEKANYDCVFWTADGCSAYEARPIQCSTYPFWPSLLDARESWEEEAAHCPGIGRGELRTRRFIEDRLYERRAAGTVVLAYGSDPESMDADTILGR
ncbi:MAG TPA: YkgJ family cysteine cluster protein [Spirochaetales bacterium]|nr:YkgJ family cysteine cluster protein [Spirochaetales bacterium]HRY56040.1 YkgJ family cysteine cluster protein [Spirochaetia bacterium]HRZ65890.1 YkgJ family cysteine cluster protein [Spirochaetia bacterium]